MYDKNLVIEILEQIHNATVEIESRFTSIKKVEDFSYTPNGKIVLDSICMLLIATGDSLKKIDKITNKELLTKYNQVDWTGAKGTRDIIAHHYFDVDAEQIFYICKHHIPPLQKTIQQIIKDLKI